MTQPAPSAVAVQSPPKSPVAFGERGIRLATIDDLFRWGQVVIQSGLAPKSFKTPQQVMIAVQWGAEIGFSPMQSLTALPVINGVPRIMVEPALALVLASGLLVERHERFEGEGLMRTAIVALVRKGGLAVERRFSIADAKKAGLMGGSGPWQGYPDRMLFARTMGYALHDLFSDVLRGIRVLETMDDGAVTERIEDFTVGPPGPRPAHMPPAGPDPLLAMLEGGHDSADELGSVVDAEAVPVQTGDPTE